MAEPLRHRQTKGADTDMPSLPPPRHIPTLPRVLIYMWALSVRFYPLVTRFEEWKEANLHGVVVVRHGKLAFEHYFRGYDLKARTGPGIVDFNAATTHDLRSMTKSMTALVMGTAIDRGMIADVDQPVLSFFPDYGDLRKPEKERVTIRHLLTMSMGLAWDDGPP